ncbi:MAG TPA: hypothetical protein VM936_07575 [Pyrinomonadaceae bacterium]|jgi:hypothetical protein|nr:hypothetical protein [Pyrinomonadaceae bacterium]
MYLAFCPGPEGPVFLVLVLLVFAVFCASVFALLFVMKLVSDRRKRRAMWSSPLESAGGIPGL